MVVRQIAWCRHTLRVTPQHILQLDLTSTCEHCDANFLIREIEPYEWYVLKPGLEYGLWTMDRVLCRS